jgi:hypothetical protein
MSPKWSRDTANSTNWKLIRVHRIVDSGTNLHILPDVVKLFDQKCLPNTNIVLTKLTIMTTCSSKTYFILSLHISIQIFLCHATAQIMPRPQHFFRYLDHTQLDQHIQSDSSETVINPSCRVLFTQHKRWTSMNAAGFKPIIPAIMQPQTYALDHAATAIS